jgi:cupin superfamily acireductone dioxygenase involved in methionine salvage
MYINNLDRRIRYKDTDMIQIVDKNDKMTNTIEETVQKRLFDYSSRYILR